MRNAGILVWICCGSLLASLLPAQTGKVKLLKSSHYFGWVKEEGGKVGYKFEFVNTGNAPVRITEVKSTCGCTAPDWPSEAVEPGDTAGILVAFNPENRPGSFRKQVYYFTDGSPSKGTLTISGRVKPRPKGPRDYYPFLQGKLRLKTDHLTFGTLPGHKSKSLKNIFYNRGEYPIHFDLSKSPVPDFLEVRLSKTTLEPGDTLSVWTRYDAGKRDDWGYLDDSYYLLTDDPAKPMKPIQVSAHIRPYIQKEAGGYANLLLDQTEINYGEIAEGEIAPLVLKFRNTGKAPLKILRLYSRCSCLEFQYDSDPVPPGESGQILVRFNTRGRIGQIRKEFFLVTNSYKSPERTLISKIKVVR